MKDQYDYFEHIPFLVLHLFLQQSLALLHGSPFNLQVPTVGKEVGGVSVGNGVGGVSVGKGVGGV